MPKKSKIRSINVPKKWKTWYIKSKSKTSIVLSYCEFLFSYHQLIHFFNYLILFRYIFNWQRLARTSKRPPIAGTISCKTTSNWPKISLFFEKKTLNINIVSYFLETLASPNEKTWHDTGGPITQTINHFSLNPNHQRSVEKTW